jgi:hypothetical protein
LSFFINGHHQKIIETELEIDPVSLVSRIVSVREQLAKEFTDDFDTLVIANNQILSSYFDTQKTLGLEDFSDTVEFNEQNDDYNDSNDGISTLITPYSDRTQQRRKAFDRHVGDILLSNTIFSKDRNSSPLRKGNFDLMLLLATQESIHRVLRNYARAGDEREMSFHWLRDFYTKRLNEYFDGHQRYGRADDFLEELLLTPPIMKSIEDKSKRNQVVGLIDPLRIAEDIIRTRSEVTSEWKDIIANVPHEHMELRRLLLAKQMGKDVDITLPRLSDVLDTADGFQ